LSVETVLAELRSKGDPKSVEGMARFGISSEKTLGVSVPTLRSMARRVGTDHSLAIGLWRSGVHEARILASMVDDPERVSKKQMDDWAWDFDSWDVCDQCCGNLFDKTPHAFAKAAEWSGEEEEFVKRAGYVLLAVLAVHDKGAPDSAFIEFFRSIERGAADSRNFVKKAVNWALRQIGKRNVSLNREAISLATKIGKSDSPAARWVASDALRELKSRAVRRKVRRSS
jgi:3-methyladenine DNA glycosylase AlkD